MILMFTVGFFISIFVSCGFESFVHLTLPGNINNVLAKDVTVVITILFLFLFILVLKIHKRSPKTIITAHKHFQWSKLGKGLLIGFIILSISSILDYLIDPTGYEWTFNPNLFGLLILASLINISLWGFFEEVFYRGYLLQAFGALTKRPLIPILTTSIIFGLLHYDNGINSAQGIYCVIVCGISGLTWAVITIEEGGLETAIGIHIITNLFLALILNNPDNWGELPSLITIYSESSTELIEYIPGMIGEIGFMLLTWLFVFWGRLGVLRDVLSFRRGLYW